MNKRTIIAIGFIIVLVSVLVSVLIMLPENTPKQASQEFTLGEIFDDDAGGFSKATTIIPFSFPADHGPHPDFKNEWWYYTGNLKTLQGRKFGYQLTFFRLGLARHTEKRSSNWAADTLYMAHFALTDIQNGKFYSFERFARQAQDLSGAQSQPFKVWLEDWSTSSENASALPMKLFAKEDNVSIDLTLNYNKPPVLQGDQGLSQKSDRPGNASYYYSFPLMPTTGHVRIGEDAFEITGNSWMDREWSTSALEKNQAGWDWFALQLSDNRQLMFYQIRWDDGRIDPISEGTLVMANGSSQKILLKDITLKPLSYWQSPITDKRYPIKWQMQLPSRELDLIIEPKMLAQEMNLSVIYWEGAVKVQGSANGEAITGQGYIELSGY